MFLVKNGEEFPCISIKDLTCAAISGLFSTQNGRSMGGGVAYIQIYGVCETAATAHTTAVTLTNYLQSSCDYLSVYVCVSICVCTYIWRMCRCVSEYHYMLGL